MHENMLLNVFNSTVDRLNKKNCYFKGRKFKNRERIDRLEGKCPMPQ